MKVAITAMQPGLDSQVDPRFGRAAYILVIDTESGRYEVLDNAHNVQSFKGAGIQAASMIHEKGAEVLLTGFCGPKAFQTLSAAGIKVISDVSGSIAAAVDSFAAGRLDYTSAPNAEAHW